MTFDVVPRMEPLNRTFRPKASSVLLPVFLLAAGGLALIAAFGSSFPWINTLLLLIPVATVLVGCILSMTRLILLAEDSTFSVAVRLGPLTLLNRIAHGESWHAISFPSGHIETQNDFTRYNIEVQDESGERVKIMGGFLGFVYGVDSL